MLKGTGLDGHTVVETTEQATKMLEKMSSM